MRGKLGILAACLLAVTASHAAEKGKCTAAAKECEYQIREILAGKRYLGARVEDSRWGVVVSHIYPGSPAARSGLQVGDRIFAVNGRETGREGTRQFKKLVNEAATKQEGRIYFMVIRLGRLYRLSARMTVLTKEEVDKIVAAHLKEAHPDAGN